MRKIKTGSDFSGVGAFDQALQRLGIEQDKQFACDMDKFARLTYILNFGTPDDLKILETPDCKKIDSVYYREYNSKVKPTPDEWDFVKENEERVARSFSFYYPWNVYSREIPSEPLDKYMTSPPCQAFSLAGRRGGEEDKRGVLFYNSHEFIQKNKPRFFQFENVKGLLSDDCGKTFQRWIDLLGGKSVNGNPVIFPHDDAVPYHVYYQVLNAKHYGIPQNRERIFIIGIRDDVDNDFSFPKPIQLEKRLKDVLESEVDDKYFLSDKMITGFVEKVKRTDWTFEPLSENDENSKCVTSHYAKMGITDNYIDVSKIGYINQDTQASQVYSEQGIVPNICAGTHGYANGYVEIDSKQSEQILLSNSGKGRKFEERDMLPPLRAHEGCGHDNYVKVVAFGRSEEEKKRRKETFAKTGKDSGSFKDKSLILKDQDWYDTLLASPNPVKEGLVAVDVSEQKILGYTRDVKGNVTSRHEKDLSGTIHTSSGGGGNTDQFVVISANTSKGYDIAEEEEDSINFSNPNSETRRGRVGKKVSQTLDTACNQGIYTQQRIRRLTPRECGRLMDFNEDMIERTINSELVSDSQLYKQAGNSICVGVLVKNIERMKL